MTNSIYGDSKSNSYTLLILSDGSKSYAVLQYISIEWPEKDITVSSAKPPEAGIFMKHPNGFQLPRSGQSVEVFKWTDESNVAVPGEWIFPLHDTQTDTDAALHHFPSIAAEFTKQLKKTCHRGVDGTRVSKNSAIMSDGTQHLNDQPKSAEADVLTEETAAWDTDRFPDGIDDYYDYDGLEDDWSPNTDSIWPSHSADVNERAGNNTEADVASVLPEFGPTVPIMPEVVEETEIPMGVYDGDEDRMNTEEPKIVPKTFIPQDTEIGLVTQGSMESPSEASPGWEVRTDRLPEPRPFETPTEPYIMARSLEPRVSYDERCDAAAECKVTDSECFRVQGLACCVCRDGYYGSGNHKCYSQENDHNYAFKGTLKLKLIPDEAPKEIPVYLDIQVGKNPRSSSGLRSIDPHLHEFHSIRFLMPIFHLLDGLIATSCSSDPDVGRARTYNLFSLGSAFQEEFKLQFAVNIEGVGRMSVAARLRVENEYSSSYSRGTVDMEVTATEPFTLVTRSYTEGTYRNNDQGRNYYTSYHVDNYGRIIFSEQPTAFSAESRGTTMEEIAMDELVVRWSGTGEVSSPGADNPASGCLLQSGSPVPKNQHFYLRMQERGYCGVDCSSSDGLCNLYCVDVTSVHAREPDACTCIHCQREGEICKPAGSSYSCDCAPGLLRMVDQTCQADTSGSVFVPPTEQCGPVYCHQFARCIEPQQGFCQCMPGYRGDGISRCEDDPCSRCQRNEVCVNDVCRPSGVDLCEGIQCGRQAVCRDGACICNPGYTGDPMVECLEERDPCNGVQCHQYGVCEHGRCRCIEGYEGDGVYECRYRDMCDNVQCHYYGECHMGRCQCRQGYEGDGYWECRPRTSDSCDGIRCHQYGKCEYGRCRCIEGYEGDGQYDCRPAFRDPCDRVRCHVNARCVDGHCRCEAGFEGDGYYFCNRTISDPCEGIYCHQYGRCEYGRCRCVDGYEGDGRYDCRPSPRETCGGHQCHPNARCVDDRCRCEAGFQGDGYYSCNSTPSDPCEGIRCHQYARCEYGQCRCMEGYEGDGHYDCRPLSRDPCEGVRCHTNARCVNGHCQCEPGFEGDGYYFCNSSSSDPCEGVLCHQYARCEHGRCRCMDGYDGDGQYHCRPMPRDPCEGIRCHMNARCINGRCQCDRGFEGDGYYSCNETVFDLCEGVVCHQNGHCRNGQCVCNPGYEGDGYWQCSHPREPEFINVCKDVRCHKFAYCDNGRCVCRDGFQGDGYWSCTPRRDLCADVRCHPNARCEAGYCHCLVGYEGDGYRECRELQQMEDPCTKVQCHTNARCEAGECRCLPGYTGDGYRDCRPANGDLCAGVQCHAFGQCYENRCYCSHGYVGDGVNFCDPRTDDPCDNVRCAANAVCQGGICSCNPGYRGDGYHECRLSEDPCAQMQCHQNAYCEGGVCRCMEGYQGDGMYECQPRIEEDLCSKVQCHPDADCYQGQCICRPGYVGDGYRYCRYPGWGQCIDQNCHPYAHCVNDRCQCKPGFEGDGYSVCTPSSSVDPSRCENCRGIPLNELAQCINGRCVCAQGFIESRPGTCTECVPSDCHVNAACLPNAQYGGVYSCQCKSGYSGDGVKNCNPDKSVGPEPDRTCGGGCYVRNSECNRLTGRCECRHGYDGDGRISCTWNCQLCLSNAICDRENERCTCMEGYYGDGQTFCERITPQPESVTVQITGQGDIIRVADLQKPLTLFCYVTTKDESITGQWTQPKGAQPAEVSMNRLPTGLEIQLRIAKPALTDAGRYYCRAKQAEAYIDVAIHETAMPYDIFLTSDDGILKVRSSGQNSTIASLWNLAEDNKYARVAMVTDCNRQSVIYTCDFGNTIRWGNAHHTQKELSTSKIYQSQLARFRNLAVDPPSGNIYAWDEAASQMIVLNPDKPHMKHTLSNIGSFKQGEPVRLAGMALHSSRGLLYWAAFTDGWMPNGTIQVASMAGENERQLLQLNGEPLALSLSPSYDDMDKSAGRLCWIQRSITNVFALATEMHCARLSEDGRSVIMQERLRQFNPTEEPSWGLVHHRGTVLWTDASKPVYYSANPARRVHVRLVCCSNRFQSIATLAVCNPGMSNACTYSNGRCRHFCLPGEGQHSRTCVCPDSQPGCHREM
ncbi:hypothetical protein CRM22_008913 [Opisthorchis felineus]|uniref:Ig-like domain-containing protein n=1 Tax=Opisthorchis felineus TaxID=147828 RepID=A0A4S2L927_OPIFE|nr:hypothetical protein CRM22_008913 [Opisthorchis felineus]